MSMVEDEEYNGKSTGIAKPKLILSFNADSKQAAIIKKSPTPIKTPSKFRQAFRTRAVGAFFPEIAS